MKNPSPFVWSFEDVEDALVDTAALWWRSPGGGKSPWATDGPWQWSSRELYSNDEDNDAPPVRLPLNRHEVAKRDTVSDWLRHVPVEADRKLVVLVVGMKARSGRRTEWQRVQEKLGIRMGRDGLRRRYERAIAAVAKALTRGRVTKGW